MNEVLDEPILIQTTVFEAAFETKATLFAQREAVSIPKAASFPLTGAMYMAG
jgi:hypothetical protein